MLEFVLAAARDRERRNERERTRLTLTSKKKKKKLPRQLDPDSESARKKAEADRLRAAERFMVVGTGEATCGGCGYEYSPKAGVSSLGSFFFEVFFF